MPTKVDRSRAFLSRLLLSLLLVAAGSVTAQTQSLRLGEIEFPTSAQSEQAQQHFLRGVAALHSFWYPVAREQFRQAQQVEPGFALAYWGEAMTYDHPVWGEPQDAAAGRAALQRIPGDAVMSARERAWIDAVRKLYFGSGDAAARERAYAQAMAELHERYPDDDEAALFHALALLGLGDRAARLRAGAIATRIFAAEPNHPGAAHYTIHAWDDAQHARRALPAARRYADIAPDAPHALHMPSHIFLQLGMWPETARSNERAWAASREWVREHDAPAGQLDFHSLQWLHYAYLQQGRADDAAALLPAMQQTLDAFEDEAAPRRLFAAYTLAAMQAAQLIETEAWQRAADILGEPVPPGDAYAAIANSPATFARGIAAAATGATAEAQQAAATLRGLEPPAQARRLPYVAAIAAAAKLQARMIEAKAAAAAGDKGRALEIMRKVVAAADKAPRVPAPPRLIKPPHELLADIALQAGREQQALRHYRIALQRHAGRAQALHGAAQAAR